LQKVDVAPTMLTIQTQSILKSNLQDNSQYILYTNIYLHCEKVLKTVLN